MIEYLVDTEMHASGLVDTDSTGKPLDLQARFERVYTHLNATAGRVRKGDLSAIRTTLTAKNGPVSFGALNGYVHNRFQKPSPDDLRNAWDHAVPLLVAVYGVHA